MDTTNDSFFDAWRRSSPIATFNAWSPAMSVSVHEMSWFAHREYSGRPHEWLKNTG